MIQSPNQSDVHHLVFPVKLHVMLDSVDQRGLSDIVSWIGETSFRVHNKELFMKCIAPHYFQQTKYRSFQRMTNMWGFELVRKGAAKGAYNHPLFRRGQPDLCCHMKLERVKNTIKETTLSPKTSSSSIMSDDSIQIDCEDKDCVDKELVDFQGRSFHFVSRCDEVLLQSAVLFDHTKNIEWIPAGTCAY